MPDSPKTFANSKVSISLPPDKNFLVWLSHDVDRVRKTFFHSIYYTFKERRLSHMASLAGGANPYWNFDQIMDLENDYGVKSTFFFLNESMKAQILKPYSFVLAKGRYKINDPKIQTIIKKLDQNGWEVGVHGSFNSYQNKELLKTEKNALEEIVGHPITGIRQHYLNLNIPQTWEMQKSLGFQYDASFGLTQNIGYRDDVFYPFKPFNDEFTIYPMAIMDSALFAKHRNVESAWQACLDLIQVASEKKTLLSLLWHQRVFNDRDFLGYTEIYKRVIEECQRRKAQFCTGKDVNTFFTHAH